MSQEHDQVMDRPALRRFLSQWPFCGCGNPEDAASALLRLLSLHPLYEHWRVFAGWVEDEGIRYLLLYMLDGQGLTEHGSSIAGAWLTEKGEAVKAGLEREQADGFEALLKLHCVHGYDVDDDSHDCMAADD